MCQGIAKVASVLSWGQYQEAATSAPKRLLPEALLYRKVLCAGVKECRWTSEQAQAASLRVVRERAMWELSKLVKTKADKSQGEQLSCLY